MLSTLSIMEGLNEGQAGVVTAVGPALVVAGPGSGKTLAIVRRIAYLVQQGHSPESILAVTFTNRAAREMRERLQALLGAFSRKVFVGTLHLLGLRILREHPANGFVIYGREKQVDLLRSLSKGSSVKAADLAERISYIKSIGRCPSEEMKVLFEAYEAGLSAQNALDFDDLILKPTELLNDSEFLRKFRDRFSHIIVDEYQDVNPAQYRLLKLLAGEKAGICVVGDPDQAIYGFRGADVGNFLNFQQDFAGAVKIVLGTNYRSSKNIVGASGTMIVHNKRRVDKTMCAVKKEGRPIGIISVPDERTEGEFIVAEIESRIGGLSHDRLANTGGIADSSSSFSDFAVIYRTNSQAQLIEEALSEAGIPCRVLGRSQAGRGARLYDTIFSLKRFADEMDNRSRLFAMDATEFMEDLREELHIESDGIADLMNHIRLMFGESWPGTTAGDIIDELSLFVPADDFDPRADAVTLMTLHMAKGLEFKVVFIAGVEDGLIPYRRGKSPEDPEEERRLFYVGMTRARDDLFLVHKRKGFQYGKRLVCSPSPFLSEIEDAYVQRITIPDRPKKPRGKEQMKLF